MGWRDTIQAAQPSTVSAPSGATGGWRSTIKDTSGMPAIDETVQEMHPDFSVADRFVTKNFSNDDQASVDYLKKRHPNLDIQLDPKTNQIKARSKTPGKDDGKFRVLDPDLGVMGEITHPGEMLQDLGDVGYDALAGVGSTAAGAASALAALPETLGIGSIPAAMAGGAAASAGLEGARQGIGGLLGVNNSANLGQIGLAGAGGAVSPLLFGTGASAAGIAEKALASGAAPEAIAAAQKGLVGRAASAVGGKVMDALPAIGEKLSGVPKDRIQGLLENFKAVQDMRNAPKPMTDLGKQASTEVGDALRQGKTAAWSTYSKAADAVGDQMIDATPVHNAFKQAIADASKGDDQEVVDQLTKEFNRLFTKTEKNSGTVVPRQTAAELGATREVPSAGTVLPEGTPGGMRPETLNGKPTGARDTVTGALVMEPAPTAGTYTTARGGGAAIDNVTGKTLTEDVRPNIDWETLGGEGVTQTPKEQIPLRAAIRLERKLGELGDLGSLGPMKGGVGNRYSPTASYADKAVGQTAVDAKNILGDAISKMLPEDALAAKAEYGRIANIEKQVKPLFKDTSKAFRTLRNLGADANAGNRELLQGVDQEFGTKILPQSRLAGAFASFRNPSVLPVSGKGTTSTARAGALGLAGAGAGYEVDKHYGGGSGAVGAGLGGLIGGALGGPAALQQYLKMALKTQGAAGAIPNFVTPAAANTAWGAINH